MSEAVVLLEKREGVATMTMNRPERMNALSSELMFNIGRVLEELSQDAETRVLIITGAGKAFCGGLDLKELGAADAFFDQAGQGRASEFMFRRLDAFQHPVIGAINGAAVAGGFELALFCDILIASEEARFADTHARVGYIPGGGLSQILPRLIGPGRAKELSFTGNYLSAVQAEAWGLVNRVVAPEELLPVCRRLAADIVSCDAELIKKYKRLINDGFRETLAAGLVLEQKVFQEHAQQVTAESVAARRQSVLDRGRGQKDRK